MDSLKESNTTTINNRSENGPEFDKNKDKNKDKQGQNKDKTRTKQRHSGRVIKTPIKKAVL